MKKLFFRIWAAATAAKAAFLQPDIMVDAHFRIMASMYENILKVQEQKSPLMFQIGFVLPDNEAHAIATVWVGAGADSSPLKRIEELYNENQEIKRRLRESV
jgi:hypothetical protein